MGNIGIFKNGKSVYLVKDMHCDEFGLFVVTYRLAKFLLFGMTKDKGHRSLHDAK